MVGVGLWDEMPADKRSGGRFIDAMRVGVSMGTGMPEELSTYMDEQIAEGREHELITMLTQTYHSFVEARIKRAKAERN